MRRLGRFLACSYYRVLLLAYPSEFRRRSGEEAVDVFARVCEESWSHGGALPVLRRLLAAARDVPRCGLQERLAGRRRAVPYTRRHRRGLAAPLIELASDTRYASRSLCRRPGLTLAIVATLALGIGANTAIFSVVNATLLAPLPWRNVERLVFVSARLLDATPTFSATVEELQRWREEAGVFERLEAHATRSMVLGHIDGARRVSVEKVSTGYLDALDIEPMAGRFLRADDYRPDANPVVIVTEAAWRRLYDADPRIVGSSITLDGIAHVVVGITPEARYLNEPFLLPLPAQGPDVRTTRARGVAWLRPGISLEEARERLAAVSSGFAEGLGRFVGQIEQPGNNFRDSDELRNALLTLLAAVFFVLTIACVNVANLLLASASVRRGELAVRAALGAGRLRLARFLMVESLLMSTLGGVLGVFVARGGIELMLWMRPGGLLNEGLEAVRLDATVLAYTTSITVLAGLAFGLLPAMHGSTTRQRGALQASDSRAGGGRQRLRAALVTVETALSLVLLVAAGLTFRSFVDLRLTDPGFDAERVMSVNISLPEARYPDESSQRVFYDALLARAGSISQIEAVSLEKSALPPSYTMNVGGLLIDGRASATTSRAFSSMGGVRAGFLKLAGIPLLDGRDLDENDIHNAGTATEIPVVVNSSMARRFWPEGDALGARFRFDTDRDERWKQVVGVAADVTQRSFDVPAGMPHYYLPLADTDLRGADLLVRLHPDVPPPVAEIRSAINGIDPEIPTGGLETAATRLVESIADSRFRAALFGSFGAVAAMMAALGISSVVAYAVVHRTREMGIRLALGADPKEVLRLTLLRGITPVILGIVLGLAIALGVTRWMVELLPNLAPSDPLTYSVTVIVLCAVGLLAAWIPARRAATVDPAMTLRRS